MTVADYPLLPMKPDSTIVISEVGTYIGCFAFKWKGQDNIHNLATSINYKWGPSTESFHDTSLTPVVVSWQHPELRSEAFGVTGGDTVAYDREFQIGDFAAGDTTEGQSHLVSKTDFVEIRTVLRDALTDTNVMVVDSAILRSTTWPDGSAPPYYQTDDLSDSGRAQFVIPAVGIDSVYLAVEVLRGDSTNDYSLSASTIYDDSLMVYPSG